MQHPELSLRVRLFTARDRDVIGDQPLTCMVKLASAASGGDGAESKKSATTTTCSVVDIESGADIGPFSNFDNVFWSVPDDQLVNAEHAFADQAAVYDKCGAPAVEAALNGVNTCFIA